MALAGSLRSHPFPNQRNIRSIRDATGYQLQDSSFFSLSSANLLFCYVGMRKDSLHAAQCRPVRDPGKCNILLLPHTADQPYNLDYGIARSGRVWLAVIDKSGMADGLEARRGSFVLLGTENACTVEGPCDRFRFKDVSLQALEIP